jgi:hypothetical protein
METCGIATKTICQWGEHHRNEACPALIDLSSVEKVQSEEFARQEMQPQLDMLLGAPASFGIVERKHKKKKRFEDEKEEGESGTKRLEKKHKKAEERGADKETTTKKRGSMCRIER